MANNTHKSYMRRQGRGWIVCHWDESVQCYRESEERPYWVARAQVGQANCRHPQTCTAASHDHREPSSWEPDAREPGYEVL